MPPASGDFDVMLQFTQDVVNDIIARVLDDPITLALTSPRILPRRLVYPSPPAQAQVLLWWDQSTYQLDKHGASDVIVALPIHGGFRRQQTIYTVDGVVRVRRKMQIRTDTDGAIFVSLDPANLTELNAVDLSQLRVSRARAPQSTMALLAGGRAELLAAVLLVLPQLVSIPMSYAIDSLALPLTSAQNHGAPEIPVTPERRIPVRAAGVAVVRDGGAPGLALGIALSKAADSAASMRSVLPSRTSLLSRVLPPFMRGKQLNVALTLSATGLTALFAQRQVSGGLAGEVTMPTAPVGSDRQHARAAEGAHAFPSVVRWRWESLTVTCAPQAVTLSGNFAMNETTVPVTATLRSWLDDGGRLHTDLKALRLSAASIPSQDTGGSVNPQLGAAIIASWNDLLLSLVRAAPPSPTTSDPYLHDVLVQRFVVPGTSIKIEAPGVALTIGEGELTIFYAVPQSVEGMVGEIIGHIG